MSFTLRESQESVPSRPDRLTPSSAEGIDKEDSLKPTQGENAQPLRILIVDRDSMSADLLVNALTRGKLCEASSIHPMELLRALATTEIDLVVVGAEVQTETGTGCELAHAVARRYPDLGIVILLQNSTREAVIRAFRSGARGVFSRHQPIIEFFDCVEHVRRGYIWASKEETDALVEAFKSIPTFSLMSARETSALTSRERQVVHCAARGKTNRAIAGELNLSEHTVKNYLFRAFEKLGVSNRVELLFYLNLQGNAMSSPDSQDVENDTNTA